MRSDLAILLFWLFLCLEAVSIHEADARISFTDIHIQGSVIKPLIVRDKGRIRQVFVVVPPDSYIDLAKIPLVLKEMVNEFLSTRDRCRLSGVCRDERDRVSGDPRHKVISILVKGPFGERAEQFVPQFFNWKQLASLLALHVAYHKGTGDILPEILVRKRQIEQQNFRDIERRANNAIGALLIIGFGSCILGFLCELFGNPPDPVPAFLIPGHTLFAIAFVSLCSAGMTRWLLHFLKRKPPEIAEIEQEIVTSQEFLIDMGQKLDISFLDLPASRLENLEMDIRTLKAFKGPFNAIFSILGLDKREKWHYGDDQPAMSLTEEHALLMPEDT